jgi:hypothetical protein
MASKKSNLVCSLIAALVAVFLMAAPAFAGPSKGQGNGQDKKEETSGSSSSSGKSDKAKDNDGDADSDSRTAYTEDNDTNDGGTPNNVEDGGDNKHPSGKDRSVENGNSGNQGKSESDPDDDGRGPDRSNGGPDKPNGSGGEDLADQDGNNGCGNDDDFEDDNEGWCGGKPKQDKAGNPPCDADPVMPGNQPCVGGGQTPCDKDPNMPGVQPCEKDGKITICHATGSMTNPYVIITISINGLNGHGGHEGDIIPAPAGGCPGPDEVLPTDEEPEVREDDAEPDVVLDGLLREDDTTVAAERQTTEVLGAVLPFTGASILSFLGAALSLIAAGLLALRSRRTS